MDLLVTCSCLALLVSLTPGVEPYTEMYIDGTASVDGQQSQNPYLWFGPRLGRRKRNMGDSQGAVLEDSLISVLEDTPWALVPLRSLHGSQSASSLREVEEVPDNSKAPPFAPRLGRRRKLLPFSPRLGREMEPVERFERSTDKH
ncbi:PBAN-type neuropeptides-like [Macrosteles quadrilineatus]|uniref:PBAN-type neuropeptides-like n=1 Tax=Macrosteles quadrilineatus TaxID=74068 RepID=UPI0023E23DC0|nr:PBAN-type neuropeptides-like [Macrosteles quadrilineatus]